MDSARRAHRWPPRPWTRLACLAIMGLKSRRKAAQLRLRVRMTMWMWLDMAMSAKISTSLWHVSQGTLASGQKSNLARWPAVSTLVSRHVGQQLVRNRHQQRTMGLQ